MYLCIVVKIKLPFHGIDVRAVCPHTPFCGAVCPTPRVFLLPLSRCNRQFVRAVCPHTPIRGAAAFATAFVASQHAYNLLCKLFTLHPCFVHGAVCPTIPCLPRGRGWCFVRAVCPHTPDQRVLVRAPFGCPRKNFSEKFYKTLTFALRS